PHQTVLQWNDGLGNDAAAGDFRLTRPSASRFILHHHLFIERTDIAESERPACADCCGTWDPGGIDRCEPRYTVYAAPLHLPDICCDTRSCSRIRICDLSGSAGDSAVLGCHGHRIHGRPHGELLYG